MSIPETLRLPSVLVMAPDTGKPRFLPVRGRPRRGAGRTGSRGTPNCGGEGKKRLGPKSPVVSATTQDAKSAVGLLLEFPVDDLGELQERLRPDKRDAVDEEHRGAGHAELSGRLEIGLDLFRELLAVNALGQLLDIEA